MRHPLFMLIIAQLCLTPLISDAAENKMATAITTVTPLRQLWPDIIPAMGVVTPWQEAIVSANSGNMAVVEINAAVGDLVTRGTLLARLDDRIARADVQRAQAELIKAEASLQQNLANAQRMRRLYQAKSVSDQDLLKVETELKLAQAQELSAKASLTSQQVRLDDTRIIAPDDGLITARNATLGQVPATGTELFRLIRQNRLEWRAELTAAKMEQVKPGQHVSLLLPSGARTEGQVRQLAGALDNNSRMGTAYVDILPGSGAKSAMYIGGQIEVEKRQALTIPAQALLIRDGRSVVFRIDDGKAYMQEVTVGLRRDNAVEITQGIRENDLIALKGAGFLNNGEAIRVMTAKGKE